MRDRRAELRHLLNEWDFIGVFDVETNFDEYDCMIGPLLAQLANGAGPDDAPRKTPDIRGSCVAFSAVTRSHIEPDLDIPGV